VKVLHAVVDQSISPVAMIRPNIQAGRMLACQLLAPAFLGAFRTRYPTPGMEIAAREFGRGSAAPVLCGYAVRAVADPGLAALAMRNPRGKALVAAAIDCLGGSR
jgi:hypothetical protein